MPPTVEVGAILMKDWSRMKKLLGLESEAYSGEWSVLKALDVCALDRKIHAAGWNFFFMATEIKVMFFGSVGAAKIQNALKRILAKVKQQHFNGLEVTAIVTRHFLGVPYVTVSAHSRHMQQSCCLDTALARQTRGMGSSMNADRATENRPMNSAANQSLDRTLECAIVVSWPDLTHGAQTGLIHVEYGFAPTGTLDYLKVWSSIARGHWLLACEYWTSGNTFHSTGVRFDNGYESEELAHILEFVMQHQNSFVLPPNLGRQRLLQISTPTAEESAVAVVLINAAFDRVTSTFAEPAVA